MYTLGIRDRLSWVHIGLAGKKKLCIYMFTLAAKDVVFKEVVLFYRPL